MHRASRDGCSESEAVRRRLNYIAAERKIDPAGITKVTARRMRLVTYLGSLNGTRSAWTG